MGNNEKILHSDLMPKEINEEIWQTIFSGGVWHGELFNRKKNGELYWEDAVISPIVNENGVTTNFVAVKEDITEKKRLWTELVAAKEKAEESDRLKSAFLANISHEIRTPMNGILGFAELLKEPELTGEEQSEYISLIQQSGERMLGLINDLIDISRIEAGESFLQISETTVNTVIQELFAFFKPQADKKGLSLVCSTGLSDSESTIDTDRKKIGQVITNLIQNALKFTRKGGITFGYEKKDDLLEFFVTDTGIGIPPGMKEMIFDRFRQLDNSLTRNHEGSGLGLCISKAYIEMLGGTICVEPGEKNGSTFRFSIPYLLSSSITIPGSAENREERTRLKPSRHLTIVVAEDDETSRMLLMANLNGENITVLTARNGKEAVELVKRHAETDLVLMDIRMPEMNGYDATRMIKQFRPHLPVIAQTAFTSENERKKAREAGCDGFLTKPVKKNKLIGMIKKQLTW
ncbi:MAG: response regulator [Chlorobiaceae bacterium]|nr:response regulator [Chlorobiaceae bacterium]